MIFISYVDLINLLQYLVIDLSKCLFLGRVYKKKSNGLAMAAMMVGIMTIPTALLSVGLLAGKSLLISILALVMSLMFASRKSHDSGSSSYDVIGVPVGGYHHGRTLPTMAHELSYNMSTNTRQYERRNNLNV